jgi:aspartate/methionine/tyrosine aminotransferase
MSHEPVGNGHGGPASNGHGGRSGLTSQIARLRLPGGAGAVLPSVVDAERALEARARELNGPLLNLTYADTKRFPAPGWALEAFARAASGGGQSYTPYRGDLEVRQAVASSLSSFLDAAVDPDTELILTPGSQAALFIALGALVEPGDRVILADPDYLAYERLMRFVGAEVDRVPLDYTDGWGVIDEAALAAAVTPRTRCIVLSNPNNPTGAVLSAETLASVARVACEHDLVVVIDELYSRLVYDGQPYQHLAGFEGMASRTITVLGPSKTESLTGYRLGVAVAPPAIIDAMEDVLSVTALRAPAYGQWALVPWLVNDHEFLTRRVAEYQALRDLTVARLSASPAFQVELPRGTAYAFPKVIGTDVDSQQIALTLMEQADVIVNPGYQFGASGHSSFRICFAQDEDVWVQTLDRIVGAVEGLVQRAGVAG